MQVGTIGTYRNRAAKKRQIMTNRDEKNLFGIQHFAIPPCIQNPYPPKCFNKLGKKYCIKYSFIWSLQLNINCQIPRNTDNKTKICIFVNGKGMQFVFVKLILNLIPVTIIYFENISGIIRIIKYLGGKLISLLKRRLIRMELLN